MEPVRLDSIKEEPVRLDSIKEEPVRLDSISAEARPEMKNPLTAWQDGLIGNVIKIITNTTDFRKEVERGMMREPPVGELEIYLSNKLSNLDPASPEAERVRKQIVDARVERISRERARGIYTDLGLDGVVGLTSEVIEGVAEKKPEALDPVFKLVEDLVSYAKENPRDAGVHLYNAIVEDPELFLVGLGYAGPAAKAGQLTARLGKAVEGASRAGAGMTGAAVTGAGVAVPISVASQINEKGFVDWNQVKEEAAVVATLSAAMGVAGPLSKGIFKTAKSAMNDLAARYITYKALKGLGVPEGMAIKSVGASEAMPITPMTKFGEWVDYKTSGLGEFGRSAWQWTGGKSVGFLDDLGKVSESARTLRNLFEPQQFSKTPLKAGFYEGVDLVLGKYMPRLQNSLERIATGFRKARVKAKDAELVVKGLRGEKIPERIQRAVAPLRKLLRDIHQYASDAGLEVGFVKNYFPRVYDLDKLSSSGLQSKFHTVLTKHGISAEDADDIIHKIRNGGGVLIREGDEIIDTKGARQNLSIERSRKLDIPDEELAPFLVNDPYTVLEKYITGVVRRVEYVRRFGINGGKFKELLRKAKQEAQAAGRPLTNAEEKQFNFLNEVVQGNYAQISNRFAKKLNSAVVSYGLIRTLPLASITSLAEFATGFMRARSDDWVVGMYRATLSTLQDVSRVLVTRKIPKNMAREAIEDIGLGLDAAVADRLAVFSGLTESGRWTRRFFKLNMLEGLTRMQRIAVDRAADRMFRRYLKHLAKNPTRQHPWPHLMWRQGNFKGKARTYEQRILWELSEVGINAADGVAWVKRGMPDDEFIEQLRLGRMRFVNEAIVNPRPTLKPRWQSNPHAAVFASLKSFQTVFANTVMNRMYHQMFKRGQFLHYGPKQAAVAAAMWGVAYYRDELSELIKYGKEGNPRLRGMSFAERAMIASQRTGFYGVGQFPIDALYAHKFGTSGMDQMFGPTVVQLSGFFNAGGQAIEGDRRALARKIVEAIPIVTVYKPLREDLIEEVEDIIE